MDSEHSGGVCTLHDSCEEEQCRKGYKGGEPSNCHNCALSSVITKFLFKKDATKAAATSHAELARLRRRPSLLSIYFWPKTGSEKN
jgi:hypothetical protein